MGASSAQRTADVAVIGAGPAGSMCARDLALGGAHVLLIDQRTFPRDKACGDLLGPAAMRELRHANVSPPIASVSANLTVRGPGEGRITLPAAEGPDVEAKMGIARRSVLDDFLRQEAISAGAEPIAGRVIHPRETVGDRVVAWELADGRVIRADFTVGADGALSRVGTSLGAYDGRRSNLGFAFRAYVEQWCPPTAEIHFFETSNHLFPGYGWLFPSGSRGANIGIGIGCLEPRRSAIERVAAERQNLIKRLQEEQTPLCERLAWQGGWLRMGGVSENLVPANVALVGDAAGLVNPLQGEGLAQAFTSGRRTASRILGGAPRIHVPAESILPDEPGLRFLHNLSIHHPAIAFRLVQGATTSVGERLLAKGWAVGWAGLHREVFPTTASRAAGIVLSSLGRIHRASPGDGHPPGASATPSEQHSVRSS